MILCLGYLGNEDVLQSEVECILGKKSTIITSGVRVDSDKIEDIAALAYCGQSFVIVLEELKELKIQKLEDFSIEGIDFSFLKGKTFKVFCTRMGEQDFESVDVAQTVGELIYEQEKAKVEMKHPDVRIHIFVVDDTAYIGIDHVKLDLSSRDYRVYTHKDSLKGPLTYTLVHLSGYKAGDVLVDPFAKSGEVCIEAAYLGTKRPINFHRKDEFLFIQNKSLPVTILEQLDKKAKDLPNKTLFGYNDLLRNLKACKQNAKIGGVDKNIEWSKARIKDLDLRHEENTVDCIATIIPQPARVNVKTIEATYRELLHQAAFILKPGAKLVTIGNPLLETLTPHFKLKLTKKEIRKDRQIYTVFLLEK